MIYVDSSVQEAHNEVSGTPVHEQLLGELSQVHRSAEAANIFRSITGIGIGSKAELVNLFQQIKNDGYNLQAVLRDERLEKYVRRTSPLGFS